MKIRFIAFASLSLLAYTANAQGKSNKANNSIKNEIRKWELIGEKSVSRVKEYDEFPIGGSGIYSALKLKVLRSDVKFDKMVIVYDSGTRQEWPLNRTIRENEESRTIDLPGNKRRIRSVQFRYETRGTFNERARVQVWGRK